MVVANINIFVQQSTESGRLAKSQVWRGDKGKVICLFCCHSTEADTPSPYHPFLFQNIFTLLSSNIETSDEFLKLFCLTRLNGQNIVFLCLKTDSAQISTLAGKCFCGLFDFIVESNLCGHKTGFKRMSRRRNIYLGEQPDDLVVKSYFFFFREQEFSRVFFKISLSKFLIFSKSKVSFLSNF